MPMLYSSIYAELPHTYLQNKGYSSFIFIFIFGISSKRELLKTSVIAKAYVQSTNILSYLYKTEVFTEIWDN